MISPTIPFLRPRVATFDTYLPYLAEIDKTNVYTNFGPLVTRFELRLVDEMFHRTGHALTVTNATMGLALSLRQLARPGATYVLMPSFTFPAAPQAAQWAGLKPLFVDVNPATWEMDFGNVQQLLDDMGDDVAAIMPYATFGDNIDLARYDQLHREGMPVVVDAAPGLGSTKAGTQFGTSFSGVVVFSMHATKPFGIGEGGLIYSGSGEMVSDLRRASNFGFGMDRSSSGTGFNAKMSEYSAAIGLATLDTFSTRLVERRRIFNGYVARLQATAPDWTLPQQTGEPTHQFLPILTPASTDGEAAVDRLERHGVQARRYFSPPCHRQPAFREVVAANLPVTDDISRRIVSLPLWEGLSDSDLDRIVEALVQ